jgi:hypothetical protein
MRSANTASGSSRPNVPAPAKGGERATHRDVSEREIVMNTSSGCRHRLPPPAELAWWYQYYFATERGRAGYEKYRHEFARLIWQTASPKWMFDDATFDRSASSFDNADHVDIVIHNYRWRLGLATGEPRYDDLERRLAEGPSSPCRPSRSKATPMGRRTPTRAPTQASSRAGTSTGRSRVVSGTICHRKLPTPSPRPFSMWTASDG